MMDANIVVSTVGEQRAFEELPRSLVAPAILIFEGRHRHEGVWKRLVRVPLRLTASLDRDVLLQEGIAFEGDEKENIIFSIRVTRSTLAPLSSSQDQVTPIYIVRLEAPTPVERSQQTVINHLLHSVVSSIPLSSVIIDVHGLLKMPLTKSVFFDGSIMPTHLYFETLQVYTHDSLQWGAPDATAYVFKESELKRPDMDIPRELVAKLTLSPLAKTKSSTSRSTLVVPDSVQNVVDLVTSTATPSSWSKAPLAGAAPAKMPNNEYLRYLAVKRSSPNLTFDAFKRREMRLAQQTKKKQMKNEKI